MVIIVFPVAQFIEQGAKQNTDPSIVSCLSMSGFAKPKEYAHKSSKEPKFTANMTN